MRRTPRSLRQRLCLYSEFMWSPCLFTELLWFANWCVPATTFSPPPSPQPLLLLPTQWSMQHDCGLSVQWNAWAGAPNGEARTLAWSQVSQHSLPWYFENACCSRAPQGTMPVMWGMGCISLGWLWWLFAKFSIWALKDLFALCCDLLPHCLQCGLTQSLDGPVFPL